MTAAAAFNDGDFDDPAILKKLRVIVRGIIQEQRKLFGQLPSISADDLEQEGMLVACRRYKAYDEKKGGAFSVWVGDAVRNKFIDIWRVATKQKGREEKVASVRTETDEALNATPATSAPPVDLPPITHLESRIIACRIIDAEITTQLEQIENATDHEIVTALQASAFTLQRIRMKQVGSFLPCVIGTRRFTTSNFVMFAPKPKQED